MKGNNVAHSKLRTKRDFSLNLKKKRFWSEEEQRYVTLKVSCKGMRIIEKNGLEATLRDAQKKGLINLVEHSRPSRAQEIQSLPQEGHRSP